MVNGVLYTTGGTRRAVIALDAKSGELIWVAHRSRGEARGRLPAPTLGTRRLVLDRRQGRRAHRLRDDRLQAGGAEREDRAADRVVRDQRHRRSQSRGREGTRVPIDLETGEIGMHSTPAGRQDIVIIGSAMREGAPSRRTTTPKGSSARSTSARGRSCGSSTPFRAPASSAARRGRTTRGRPTATSASGRRSAWTRSSASCISPSKRRHRISTAVIVPGNNLFAESLVCVDLKTGQRKWHFQFVHHPVWNFDVSSAPILADITVDGPGDQGGRGAEQAVVPLRLRSRHGQAHVANRREVRFRRHVPGEKTSPTQPSPDQTSRYARSRSSVPDDLIDFTPELHAQAMKLTERYRFGPMFNPPIAGQCRSACWATWQRHGGTNWTGGGYDPETAHRVCAGRQHAERIAWRRRAAERVLGHPVHLGESGRAALRRDPWTGRLLCRRLALPPSVRAKPGATQRQPRRRSAAPRRQPRLRG